MTHLIDLLWKAILNRTVGALLERDKHVGLYPSKGGTKSAAEAYAEACADLIPGQSELTTVRV
jgi:hypothetical protein